MNSLKYYLKDVIHFIFDKIEQVTVCMSAVVKFKVSALIKTDHSVNKADNGKNLVPDCNTLAYR